MTESHHKATDDDFYLSYRHQDGRELQLRLSGFGYAQMVKEDGSVDWTRVESDKRYQVMSKALRRLAMTVMG